MTNCHPLGPWFHYNSFEFWAVFQLWVTGYYMPGISNSWWNPWQAMTGSNSKQQAGPRRRWIIALCPELHAAPEACCSHGLISSEDIPQKLAYMGLTYRHIAPLTSCQLERVFVAGSEKYLLQKSRCWSSMIPKSRLLTHGYIVGMLWDRQPTRGCDPKTPDESRPSG